MEFLHAGSKGGHAMKILLASAHDCLIKPVDDNELLLRITALQPRPRNRQRSLPQPELSIFHHS